MSLDRKFSEDYKNVLKTVIFPFQVGFTSDFVADCSFKLYFFSVQTLTLLFSLTVPDFFEFFMSLNRKFSEDYKNVLKTVIFPFQVGLTSDFVSDCFFKLSFW